MKGVIALGSNLGDRQRNINAALDLLAQSMKLVGVSTLIETKPVGGPEQGDYLNGVCIVETELGPEQLLQRLMEIESELGRVRAEVNGPRTIDLDLITYGEQEISTAELIIPHPRAHLRAFVLAPWFELEPDAKIPGKGRVRDLLDALMPA
jgi:2-amino-4-hydroxy-6-hydroxymethyldihydropteridine diphosphokinase